MSARRSPSIVRRRLRPPLALVVCVLVLGGFASGAAAKTKPVWALRFSGGIAGKAKGFRTADCTQREPAGNQLAPVASFEIGKKSYQIQIRFDPPVQAGPRPFGPSASASTVAINVVATDGRSWTTGNGNGTATVNADLKSGSLKGQLVGAGPTTKPTMVRGKFACATFTP